MSAMDARSNLVLLTFDGPVPLVESQARIVRAWSWGGAFEWLYFLGMRAWLEAIGVFLLLFITDRWVHGFIMLYGLNVGVSLLCAATGKQIAIKHRRWKNFDDFLACQRAWDSWAKWFLLPVLALVFLVSLYERLIMWWWSSPGFDSAPW